MNDEVGMLRAQLEEARKGLTAARDFAASPNKWRSHYGLRLKRDLDYALAVSEPEPPRDPASAVAR